MLESLKHNLSEAIKDKITCLFLSGGSESLLLLNVLLDMRATFSIMTMDTTFSSRQMQVIDDLVYEHNLRVYSYKPQAAYFIGNGERLAFVEEYALLDGTLLPFIADCVGGEKCSWDLMVETRSEVPIGFEVNIFGTRRPDRHWSFGKAFPGSNVKLGYGEILAPLWEWRRLDVIEALKNYGVKKPQVDTGNYDYCCLCLEGNGKVECPKTGELIDSIDWDRATMLDAFQNKFGVKR